MRYIIRRINDKLDESLYRQRAEELLKSSGAKAVVYGYMKMGVFIPLEEMKKCMTDEELKLLIELIELKYKNISTIRAVYKKSPFKDKGDK